MMNRKGFWQAITVVVFLMLCLFAVHAEEMYANTQDDVVNFLSDAVSKGETNISITADEAIYGALSDSDTLSDIFNASSIAAAQPLFHDGVLTLSDIVAFPNSVFCQTIEDALRAFESKAESVTLRMTDTFYDSFTKDNFALLFKLDGLAGIKSRESVYYADTRFFVYENIEYYENYVRCENRADFFRALQNAEDQALCVYLEDTLFSELTENDYEELAYLEKVMNFYSPERTVTAHNNLIMYASVPPMEETGYIESVKELENYISQCAAARRTTIRYAFSKDMFDMTQANSAVEFDICARNGIFKYTFWNIPENRTRLIKDIQYYPGAQIIYAVQNDLMEILTDEEKRLYEESGRIVRSVLEECAGADDEELLIEKKLVQKIAERCEYYLSGEDTYNTAIGVLLYGKGDCDAYADALYLLGNLAGLRVEYKIGYTLNGGSHMWNVVQTQYGRHFTDATACDLNMQDYPEQIRPDWMGIGLETAGERYIWQTIDQTNNIDRDNPVLRERYLAGALFSTVSDARAFLEENTETVVQLAVKGITEDEREQAALDTVYGYGGPYYSWCTEDGICFVTMHTWFAKDNFYDCCTEEDVIKALSAPHAEIIVRLNGDLYEAYLTDGGYALSEMEKAAGIQSSSRSLYDSTRVFLYKDIVRE